MAIGKKTGGRNFEPGKSGNPNGRPLLPGEIKEARKLNSLEVTKTISRLMLLTPNELQEMLEDKETRTIDGIIAKILLEAGKHGDHARLNFLFDRMIGKVSDKIEHKLPKPTVIKLLGEEAAVVLGSSGKDEEE